MCARSNWRWLWAAALLVAAGPALLVSAPAAEAGAPANVSVTVPADARWVDTGLDVSTGDALVIVSAGTWTDGDSTTGPDGSTKQWPDNFFNLAEPGVCNYCAQRPAPHWGALIGYIGDAPPAAGSYTSADVLPEADKIFLIGANYSAQAPDTGRLWLNKNADAYSDYTVDNHGAIAADVTTFGLSAGGGSTAGQTGQPSQPGQTGIAGFYCLGGSTCMGQSPPAGTSSTNLPNPPEWLTSASLGGCLLELIPVAEAVNPNLVKALTVADSVELLEGAGISSQLNLSTQLTDPKYWITLLRASGGALLTFPNCRDEIGLLQAAGAR